MDGDGVTGAGRSPNRVIPGSGEPGNSRSRNVPRPESGLFVFHADKKSCRAEDAGRSRSRTLTPADLPEPVLPIFRADKKFCRVKNAGRYRKSMVTPADLPEPGGPVPVSPPISPPYIPVSERRPGKHPFFPLKKSPAIPLREPTLNFGRHGRRAGSGPRSVGQIMKFLRNFSGR
jgi:hypothetical protein